jgi:hypothetical protein
MCASVEHRCSGRSAKGFLTALHRPSESRSQTEQWLRANEERGMHFFTLAPPLTAHRLPRRLAFAWLLPLPHSRTLRSNRIQRGLERPPSKTEPPLPPGFGMLAGTGRRGGFFLPTKTIPFFWTPRGGWQERQGSGDNASDTQIDDHGERLVRRGRRTNNVARAGCTAEG